MEVIKIIKIITAIGNKNLNNILKQEKDFEILEDDIFYKEGILEILEKNKNIDVLILYEKLYGEINLIDLIKKIKNIKNDIKIFIILENKNEELENLLKNENVKNFFYNNEIDIKSFITKLKNLEICNEENLEEEIRLLKNLLNQKNEEIEKYKMENSDFRETKKIIVIVGQRSCGKSLFINNIISILENKTEYNFKEIDIKNFSEIEQIKNITYKFIFIFETDLENIKNNKYLLDKLIQKNLVSLQKVNIIFNKINKYSINKKILKNIFKKFKIIGYLKLNNYCDFLINKKNNYKKENVKLKKQYLKIIKKI